MTHIVNSAAAPVLTVAAALRDPLNAPRNVDVEFARTDIGVATSNVCTMGGTSGGPYYFNVDRNAAGDIVRVSRWRNTP